jgi:LPXTG-motif cell wall-anchored protein
VNDLDHVLTVEVTAENLLDEPLTDVRMREEDEAIDFVNRMLGEGAAAIELIPGNDYSTDFGDLEAGGERTRTYEFQATEEVDADARAYLRGDTEGGSVVSGFGQARVTLDSHLALEAWMDLDERPYQAGQVVRLSGRITNLLEDETLPDGTVEEADSLAVILDPIVEGNASNGYAMTSDFAGRTPQGNTPFVLEPGESLDVRAIVPTARKDIESMAGIRYLVRAWALDPEDSDALGVEIDQSRIVIDDEDGRGTEFSTALLPVQLQPDKVQECETTELDAIISCNLWVGFREFGTGLAQLGPVIATGTVEYVRAGWAVRGWMIEQWMRSAQALLGDEEAQQRLITEIEVQMNTFVEARLISAEALDAGGGAVVEFFQEAEVALRTGDTDQIVAWTARFLGENPDLGVAAIAKVRAARALFGVALPSGSQSQATATLVRATDEAAAADRLALEAKIDEAIARGENPATNGTFKGDEDITNIPRVFRGIYGARKTELNKMLDLAAAENVLIAFRQRSARAADLIRDGLARPKPMDVKTKGVNEIDIAYLGYRREAKDLVELVEPPIDWRLARKGREAELEEALDDYMEFLEGRHPEIGADPVWRSEVRSRLEIRTKQWIKEVPNFRRYAQKGIDVEFGYAEQGLPAALDDQFGQLRKARVNQGTVIDPYTGQERLYFNVEMADANGNNFLPITGDIDIVAILNSDRTPITDEFKRIRIYRELAKLVGMQHGDSITWINTEGMIKFLREHIAGTPGAEALVVAGSDGKARMGYFEERLSEVTDVDGNVATKNTFHLVTGAPREMITDPTGGAAIDLPSYFDDLEGYTLDPRFYLPGALEDFMDGVDVIGGPPALDDTAPVIRPDGEGGAEAFQAGSGGSRNVRRAMVGTSAEGDPLDAVADEIAAAGFGPAIVPEVGAEGGRWVPFDAVAAAAASPTGRFPRGVLTATDGDVPAGTTALSVSDLATLGAAATSDWFAPGDRIVVDPGGALEEEHLVAAASPEVLTLTTPLRNDHPHATSVALVARATEPVEPPEPTTPTTEPTTPPTTVPTPTTVATPTDPPAGPRPEGPKVGSGSLPRTGAPASTAAALGMALLAAGAGILAARSKARSRLARG